MTETEKMVSKFTKGLSANRYKEIFDLLESFQLSPLGKSNTATLLFQRKHAGGKADDVFAFRLKPDPVISFPKSYWISRTAVLSELLGNFSYSEKPATTGHVSASQYSAGQISLTKSTHVRVIEMCRNACS